jgi:uncharacterized protein YoxC
MSLWFWICIAIALALAALAVVVIRHAIKSAETLEELERAWMRNRQSHRRTSD